MKKALAMLMVLSLLSPMFAQQGTKQEVREKTKVSTVMKKMFGGGMVLQNSASEWNKIPTDCTKIPPIPPYHNPNTCLNVPGCNICY